MLKLADIKRAETRISEYVRRTPCTSAELLGERTDTQLFLKHENLQVTGSFKERGACNKLSTLSEAERAHGVVVASAGNHALGVALHAQRLGIPTIIVMPEPSPLIKVGRARSLGADVELYGRGYDDAYERALSLARAHQRPLIHPFNDPDIMAGQGSIGLELLKQCPDVEAVVLPVGGGGLAAGVAVAIKEQAPGVSIYGVQTIAMPSMRAALDEGHVVNVPRHDTIADGIAVARVGEHCFEVAQQYLDDVVLVDDEEVAEAILLLMELEKTVTEGASAVALAALLQRRLPVEGKRVALILSGGNIDVNLLSRIIERGLVKSGRLMRLDVRLPDVPGSLSELLKVVSSLRANVLQVSHDRTTPQKEIYQAVVELVLETQGFEHASVIEAALERAGFRLEHRHG